MKTWADFLDEIMPELPGIAEDLAEAQVLRSAIEFMDRAHVYQADHPAIAAVTGQGGYAWAPDDADTEVCHVFNVWYEGEKLTAKNGDYLSDKYDYWPDETGTPEHYLQERTDTLILVPSPDEDLADAITVKVALKPAMTATGIPDDLFKDHREAIAAGALFRLMRMPKKPWTNFDLAAAYRQAFNNAIEEARHKQQAGNVRADHHVPDKRGRFV